MMTEKEAYQALQDPFVFVEKMWGLVPQKVLPEYEKTMYACRKNGDYNKMRLEMFEPYTLGKHITWQQAEILRAINYGRLGVKSSKISIASGHGIGKSTIIAMVVLWFLFVYPLSKIGATAPTQNQMYDVLWAEIKAWINRMPEFIQDMYEHTTDYLRMKESPENWFARARTARKESPEALAGLHAEHMLILADEASGVYDEIFNSAKSALTNENTLFVMISNPTRLDGYFYKSHHELKDTFQILKFSSKESPVVSKKFIQEIIAENDEDSDEYRVRVLGEFPEAENVDDKGYLPLYNFEIIQTKNNSFIGDMIMGVDPAGEWKDKTSIVIRDVFKAWVVAEEKQSTPESVAELVATVNMNYPCKYIYYDNFGSGANVGVKLAEMGIRSVGVNVGDPPSDSRYQNKRAEIYWKSREWLRTGWEVSKGIARELGVMKYKNTIRNKIVMIGKDEMRRRGIKSPNNADAFSLTFCGEIKKGGLVHILEENNPLKTPSVSRKRRNIYD